MIDVLFAPFDAGRKEDCLALFDANCPKFFAPNERAEYAAYLDEIGSGYTLAVRGPDIVAGFAVVTAAGGRARVNWILVDPAAQGGGVGREMMAQARRLAAERGATVVDIAASHLSAPFFARFGAREVARTADGWGPGMHRVDMEWPL